MRLKTLSEVKFDEKTTVAEGKIIDVTDEKSAKALVAAGAAEVVEAEETQPATDPSTPNEDDLDV